MRRGARGVVAQLGSAHVVPPSTSALDNTTSTQRRSYLLTSQLTKLQNPNQLYVPSSRVQGGSAFRALLRSRVARKEAVVAEAEVDPTTRSDEIVTWEDDAVQGASSGTSSSAVAVAKPQRTYVNLTPAFRAELRGDYLSEVGEGQKALEHYGFVLECFQATYPESHNQVAKLRVKVARGLRMTKRFASAEACCLKALDGLEKNAAPELEHTVEALYELGEVHAAQGGYTEAGALFEDTLALMNTHHDIGASHRGLRSLVAGCRRLHMNHQGKFAYHSPYIRDRVFALVDLSLERAEACYDAAGLPADSLRVVEARKFALDRKNFNMRDFSYKMGIMRGWNQWRGRNLSSRPSATELLAFSPTVHRPHLDWTRASTAPLGKEDMVEVGSNARILDDGDPTRYHAVEQRQRRERDQALWQWRPKYDKEVAYGVGQEEYPIDNSYVPKP